MEKGLYAYLYFTEPQKTSHYLTTSLLYFYGLLLEMMHTVTISEYITRKPMHLSIIKVFGGKESGIKLPRRILNHRGLKCTLSNVH